MSAETRIIGQSTPPTLPSAPSVCIDEAARRDERDYAWESGSCLAIAEGAPGWNQPNEKWSESMRAVSRLRARLEEVEKERAHNVPGVPLWLKPEEVCPKCKRPMLQLGPDGALWDASCGVCEAREERDAARTERDEAKALAGVIALSEPRELIGDLRKKASAIVDRLARMTEALRDTESMLNTILSGRADVEYLRPRINLSIALARAALADEPPGDKK